MKIPQLAATPLIILGTFTGAQGTLATLLAQSPTLQPVPYFDPVHPCASSLIICDRFGAPRLQEASPSMLRSVQALPFSLGPRLLPQRLPATPPTCYKLRAYEYTIVNPSTGQFRFTGVINCQPASDFRMKEVTWSSPH